MSASHQGEQPTHRKSVSRTVVSVPERKLPVYWILAGFVLLVATFYLLYQLGGYLVEVEKRLAATTLGETRIVGIGREMDDLRSKLNGLLADSVEIRLKSLERTVATGKVGSEEIQAFNALQNDLKLLENYNQASGSGLLDSGRREHARYQPVQVTPALTNQQLLEEVARIRVLFYLCLSGLVAGAGMILVLRLRAKDSPMLDAPLTRKQRQLSHQRVRRNG